MNEEESDAIDLTDFRPEGVAKRLKGMMEGLVFAPPSTVDPYLPTEYVPPSAPPFNAVTDFAPPSYLPQLGQVLTGGEDYRQPEVPESGGMQPTFPEVPASPQSQLEGQTYSAEGIQPQFPEVVQPATAEIGMPEAAGYASESPRAELSPYFSPSVMDEARAMIVWR